MNRDASTPTASPSLARSSIRSAPGDRRRGRRVTRGVAAAALALPMTAVVVTAQPAAAVVSLADWRTPYPPSWATPATTFAGLDTAVATAAQSTGVVEISTTLYYGQGQAAGTGIVIGSDGLVVTNHHVVEGATRIRVTDPSTGRTYRARVLGYDAARDVAVLRLVGASGLTAVTIDSTGVTDGESVTAVGDAGGDGGSLTAAPGTVTDARHPITVHDELTGQPVRLRHLIEVSSDVIPGDSGGALRDASGDVVGMNVAATSGTADVTGYVIPIARVLRVVDAVLAGDDSGTVVLGRAAFLGVQLGDASSALAGVVAGSPAADLGLAAGDTVTSIGGQAVSGEASLRSAIAAHRPGEQVTVTWVDGYGTSHRGVVRLARGPVG